MSTELAELRRLLSRHRIAVAWSALFKASVTVNLLSWIAASLARPPVAFPQWLVGACDLMLFAYLTFLVWGRK